MKKKLKMKDLERATGVGREAIRFYIREGLLPEPHRPARNVAWYDESFVDRILLIKRLQHERYLPLAVIRGILGAGRELSEEETRTLVELDGKVFPAGRREHPHPPEKLIALAKRIGLRASEIRELGDVGIVEIATRDGEQWLEGNSVPIVETWARLRRAGFTPERGFGPKTLAIYPQFVEWLAREELRIFSEHVGGKVDPDTARHMAEEGIDGIGRILALMRETTLLRYIEERVVAPQGGKRSRDAVGD